MLITTDCTPEYKYNEKQGYCDLKSVVTKKKEQKTEVL